MIKLIAPQRTNDVHGSGAWQAPRGYGKHRGIDIACLPDSIILSSTEGVVSKLGYMYNDDLSYRYVQVTTPDGYKIRYCYVEPDVKVRDTIEVGQPLGVVQDIGRRYKGITPHIHLGVMNLEREYINPEDFFEERS